MNEKIEIVSYNPNWPHIFATESKLIKKALGDNCIEIHHIGSTSVPDLAAKDKIDIIAEVNNLMFDHTLLENLGYTYRGGFNIPLRKSFTYRSDDLNINLHVFEKDDPEIELNILFRDYLKDNDVARNEYEKLKYQLIKDDLSHIKKEGAMYRDYTLGKGNFIHDVLKQSGFNKLRMVICTHPKEWAAAKSIYNKYFKNKEYTFDDPDCTNLVLYKGVDIIGYASVKLLQNKTARVENIFINEKMHTEVYNKQFRQLIEKWLKLLG